MNLANPTSEVFVPDGTPVEDSLSRVTRAGICAHQDDLEISAYHGIESCFGSADEWFLGVTLTDGAGSPRAGRYASLTDEQMRAIRRIEQKKASVVGEYSAQVLLDYSSAAVKDAANRQPVEDIKSLLLASSPRMVYTHNLADKHDTHVATALRVIQAIRELPPSSRPQSVYGCEGWRDLDWLSDSDKVTLEVGGRDNLATALLGVFDSQISGGKRYDLAAVSRRRAHATFQESHRTDVSTAVILAMDLTPLAHDSDLDPVSYVEGLVRQLQLETSDRISRLSALAR